MKKLVDGQKNCLITLIGLVTIVEFLLKIDNKIIQSLGILLTPFIIMVGLLLIKNDQKKIGQ